MYLDMVLLKGIQNVSWLLPMVTFVLVTAGFLFFKIQSKDLEKGIRYFLMVIISVFMGCKSSGDRNFVRNGATAHRGNSADYPENTIPAFKSALSLGVEWIELDIHKTKDGQIVVIHDATTSRVGNRNLQVSEVTFEELKSVDVAHEFRIRKKLTLKEYSSLSVPLLSDIIRLIMQQNETRLSIQPKANCVKETIAIIKKLNAEPWVGFNDGSLHKMKEVKKEAKLIPVFWDRPADTNIDEDLKIAQKEGFESIVINHFGITKAKVDKIHEAGLEIGAWTVNDPARTKTLLSMGVDRIYTDHPRRLMQLLREK